jgi:hypothetical protein
MNVVDRLASAFSRRDDEPNRELAAEIAEAQDVAATAELFSLLAHKKRAVRVDAARALASLAGFAPNLVAPHWKTLMGELERKEQVMVWPAMIALERASDRLLPKLYGVLPELVAAARRGSVIARDHALRIFVRMAQKPAYAAKARAILLEELRTCPDLQFPAYVESTLPAVPKEAMAKFLSVITARLSKLGRPSSIRRVEKALRRATRDATATPPPTSKARSGRGKGAR